MDDEVTLCPKCGSEELVEWGTNRRMCRRCHEVFVVGEEDIEKKDEELQETSKRAERFLESLREEREEAKEDYEPEEELILEEATEAEIISESSSSPEPALETSDVPSEASATQEFEELYASLKEEQAKETERYVERPKAAAPKKKTSAKKAVVWIAIAVAIWIVMIIICSLR